MVICRGQLCGFSIVTRVNVSCPVSPVRLGIALRAEAQLNQSENLFAESLAAFWIGQGFKELLTAQALHLAESFLDSTPVGNGLLQPLILLFGQGDANGLSFDFACPGITSAPGPRPSILNIALANPPSDLRKVGVI